MTISKGLMIPLIIMEKTGKKEIPIVCVVLFLLLSGGISLYFLFGHKIILTIFKGRINLLLQNIFSNLRSHPFEHYLIYGDLIAYVIFPYCLILSFLIFLFIENKLSVRFLFIAFLFSGIILRCFVAGGDVLAVQSWPLCDDSYYYFNIARNIAMGNGVRHDTFNATTGFQPLFLLMLIPIYLIVENKNTAIHLVLLLQTGFGVVFCLILYKICSLLTSKKAALISVMIWAFSIYCLSTDLNGQETGLALCFLGWAYYYYLKNFILSHDSTTKNYSALGILLGLGFLARTDLALLLPAVMLDTVISRRGTGAKKIGANLAVLVSLWLVVASPWFFYMLIMEGSILPSSGAAVRFLSLSYGFNFMQGIPHKDIYFRTDAIPWWFYLGSIKSGLLTIVTLLGKIFPLWAAIILIAAGLFRKKLPDIRPYRMILLFILFIFLAYVLYIFGQWFYLRYFAPVTIPYIMILATLSLTIRRSGFFQKNIAIRKYGTVIVFFLMAALILSTTAIKITGLYLRLKPTEYYNTTQWINRHTPKGAMIGAFQTGIVGYYIERPFYGLDGKINRAALQAMKSDRIDLYIQRNRIQFITDWPWILDALLTQHAQDKEFLKSFPVVCDDIFRIYDLR